MTEILYQIALFVVILAVIALIFVLCRTYSILNDVKDSTGVVRKRVRDIDGVVSNLEVSLRGFSDILKSFLVSLDGIKSFFKNREEKGDKK